MDSYLQEQLDKVRQKKENNLKLINLVEGLLYSFSIDPSGKDFIWYFGDGSEQTNRLAITLWVKQTLDSYDLDKAEQGILPALCSVFHDALEEMQDRNWL